jgi:hypothetical protein
MAIVNGSRRSFTNSGELLRGKMSDSRLPMPPLHDSLLDDDIGNEVHLHGHTKGSGMACSDDARGRRS